MVLEWYEPTKLVCGCTTTAYLWQKLDNDGNPVGLPEYRAFIQRRLPHCKHVRSAIETEGLACKSLKR